MDHKQLLKRINELAKKAKETSLSEEEKEERQRLRQEYIEIFRGNLKSQLDSIVVMDEKGNKTKLQPKNSQPAASNDTNKNLH